MSASDQSGKAAAWLEGAGLGILWAWVSIVLWAAYCRAPAAQGFPGESSRIVFFHVPLAIVSFASFLVSAGFCAAYLTRRRMADDDAAAAAAGLGLLSCALATATGAVFSRLAWGAYWNWDPRQTSILVILMIYGAYFALRSAVERPERRAVLSSAYGVFAFAMLPFFFFVLPRITVSLHPADTLAPAGPRMDASTLRIFAGSLAAHLALFCILFRVRIRIGRLEAASARR